MTDQAAELRHLMLRRTQGTVPADQRPPRLVLLTGAKGGVGVTTLAVNLSAALAQQGARCVLVDADLYRADAAALCGVPEQTNIGHVLSAHREIHEVLQRGPQGLQLVPGLWAPPQVSEFGERAQQRLLQQLKALGPHAELVLVDAGSSSSLLRRLAHAAHDAVLVTTADDVAVMDCYATIKALFFGSRPVEPRAALHLLVNRAATAEQAEDVYQRISQSCRRFLGLEVHLLGHLPCDPQVTAAAHCRIPFVAGTAGGEAAGALRQIAVALWDRWQSLRGQQAA